MPLNLTKDKFTQILKNKIFKRFLFKFSKLSLGKTETTRHTAMPVKHPLDKLKTAVQLEESIYDVGPRESGCNIKFIFT